MSESELLARARAGDGEAEQAMLLLYEPLCQRLARKYNSNVLSIEDRLQEARIGLLRAVRGFREEKGAVFITYAHLAIERNILRALAETGDGVRLPIDLGVAVYKLRRVQAQVKAETGEEITLAEAAEREGLAPDRFQELPDRVLSLDHPVPGGDAEEKTPLGDFIPSKDDTPEEALISSEPDLERVALVRCLDQLPAIEREVVARRIGLPPHHREGSLADVADALGYSREWVRQVESRAVRRLRSMLGLRDTELGTSLGLNLRGTPTDRQRKMIDLWNAGLTQREIAEGLGTPQSHVSKVLRSYASWLNRKPQRGSKPGEWGHRRPKCAA